MAAIKSGDGSDAVNGRRLVEKETLVIFLNHVWNETTSGFTEMERKKRRNTSGKMVSDECSHIQPASNLQTPQSTKVVRRIN